MICWKHLLTTLKTTDSKTDTNSHYGLHRCCLNTHFWELDFNGSSLTASNCFTRFDSPSLSHPNTCNKDLVEHEHSQPRQRDLCVNLRRWQRRRLVTKDFKGNLEIFVQSIKTEMLLCYSLSVKRGEQRHGTHSIPRETHTSSVTSNHSRQTAVIYTQTEAGGGGGGGE